VVSEISKGSLPKDRIPNTFGTNISCVYSHFLSSPPRQAPRRVVVLTDGLTGSPESTQAAEARMAGFVWLSD
jgi:hypothetical protein